MKNIISNVQKKICNKEIDCLIFDLDGTLFDTRKANEESYNLAFKEVGVLFDIKKYNSAFGLRFDEMMERVYPGISIKRKSTIKVFKAKYYQRNVSLVVPNTPLIEFLKKINLDNDSILICLATTASRKNVELILDHFRIKKYFDYILCGEDIKNAKPDPECYSNCVNKFSLNPQRVLIFEDSEVGLEAAKKSGAKYVKVVIR